MRVPGGREALLGLAFKVKGSDGSGVVFDLTGDEEEWGRSIRFQTYATLPQLYKSLLEELNTQTESLIDTTRDHVKSNDSQSPIWLSKNLIYSAIISPTRLNIEEKQCANRQTTPIHCQNEFEP